MRLVVGVGEGGEGEAAVVAGEVADAVVVRDTVVVRDVVICVF